MALPTWRSNQAQGIAGIDMFVVAGAKFRLLYVIIILALDADIANAAGVREAAPYRHFTDLSALNERDEVMLKQARQRPPRCTIPTGRRRLIGQSLKSGPADFKI